MKENDLQNPLTGTEQEMQDLSNLKDNKIENDSELPLDVKINKLTPYYTSNIFGKFFFNWTRYAMDTANKAPLKIVDFKGLGKNDQSQNLLKPLLEKWNTEKSKKEDLILNENAFFYAILKTYYLWIIALTILNICIDSLKYLQIYFYDSIIQYFEYYHSPEETEPPFLPIYANAVGLVLIKIGKTFFHHQVKFVSQALGVKGANAVTALIYEKVTKTSIFIKSQISEGEILNFIQVDSEKLNFLFTSLPKILTVPFNLVVSFYALSLFFGKSFIVGLTILIIMVLIIWYIQHRYLYNTKEMLKKKDKRMRLTTHTFHIIKILKLFGWEDEFRENIDNKRNDELINIKNILYLTAFRTFVNSNLSLLTSLASIGGYTYFYGAMEVKTLFSSTKLVKEVAVPLIDIPQFITDLNSLMISLRRIQNFLIVKDIDTSKAEKIEKDLFKNNNDGSMANNIALYFKNCDFGIKGEEVVTKDEYKKIADKVLLKELTLSIKKGELVSIIGETGSGKTCLINSILNNLELINENSPDKQYLICSNKISYACQDPWIMNGTIRENILFYDEYDKEKYNQVVNACQLDKDFENLKHGDQTEIGSTGNNISGGQRARIALARAIYKDADIYLFDDPISSVDTYISMKIFHQAIVNLLKNKTRIFVTHDTRNLKYSSKIIVMNQFKIEFDGNYEEFSGKEAYNDIVKENDKHDKKDLKINKDITDIKGEYFTNKDDSFGKLLRDEDQVHGKVSWRLYDLFFRIQGGYFLFLILIILTLSIVVSNAVGKDYVASWSNKAQNKSEKDKFNKEDNYRFFIRYSGILFIGICIQFVKEMLVAFSNFKSTKYLHEKMIYSLIRAPINLFHDVVPIGQILNRLIHDLDLSQEIIWMFNKILGSLIGLITSIYICFLENRESIYASPVIAFFAYLLLKYFITAGRDLNRLNGISRSPAISLFSETILGITTIRTFKQEKPSKMKFYERLDEHFGVMLYKYGSDNWFCMSLDLISHFYLGFVLIGAILGINKFDAKTVGIMLDYSSDFSEQLLEVFEQGTHVEKSLISLERCDTYTKLQSENYEDEKLNQKKNLFFI